MSFNFAQIIVFLMLTLAAKANCAEFMRIGWSDLIPHEDAQALKQLPQEIQQIEDGSSTDVFSGKMGAVDLGKFNDSDYAKALRSKRVIAGLNNKKITIPGYIVPLEFNEQQRVTAFFIVPYFGACLHLPAPPPNQIIYAKFDSNIRLENLYDPFLLSGTLKIDITENELGVAAYQLKIDRIDAFSNE